MDMIIRKLVQVFFISNVTNNPKNEDKHTDSNKGITYKVIYMMRKKFYEAKSNG